MFRTLRSKLIFSYSAVAVLCLILVVVGTLAFARDFITRSGFKTLEDKRALATPLLRFSLSANNKPQTPRAKLIAESVTDSIRAANLRVLLVDADTLTVAFDTSARYDALNQPFRFELDDAELQKQLVNTSGVRGFHKFPDEPQRIQFIATRPRLLRLPTNSSGAQTPGAGSTGNSNAEPGPLSPYIVVFAQPEVRALDLIQADLRDALLPALGIALLLSLGVGYLLARSISKPISKLAGAAAAMARGDYSQRLPIEGQDELATLTGQFNEMAAEVDHAHKMQRDFVANVSHDLKTPLTSVQGFSQAILDGAVHDEQGYQQAAKIINTEAQRMSRMVSELLNLTRLENGLSALHLQTADLGQVISQLVGAMQPQAIESGVKLKAKLGGSGATVLGDVDKLKQAFGNLIDNALKHTPDGGTVSVQVSDVPGGVEVLVQDTGEGIPPEDLPRVMERFYQIDKARSSRSIGLGLAIAREIIQAHRGQITIESAPGAGTTVKVVLPVDARSMESQQNGKRKQQARAPKIEQPQAVLPDGAASATSTKPQVYPNGSGENGSRPQ